MHLLTSDTGQYTQAIKTMSKKRLKRKVKTHREVCAIASLPRQLCCCKPTQAQGRIIKRTSELDNVRREIAIQRKLKHKNILRLIDALDLEDSDDLHMGAWSLWELHAGLHHTTSVQCWS